LGYRSRIFRRLFVLKNKRKTLTRKSFFEPTLPLGVKGAQASDFMGRRISGGAIGDGFALGQKVRAVGWRCFFSSFAGKGLIFTGRSVAIHLGLALPRDIALVRRAGLEKKLGHGAL